MLMTSVLFYRQALEKSKYEQSLETVRRFIAVSEKELELYYRHVALYGKTESENTDLVHGDGREASSLEMEELKHCGKDQGPHLACKDFSDIDTMDTSESDEEYDSSSESDVNDVATGDAIESSEDTDVLDHRVF
jgi:hypothetical protein